MSIRRFSLLLAGLLAAGSALAGPKEDLHAAFSKFLALNAFKGATTSTLSGRTVHSTVEFQAPDRYRVTSEGRPPSLIIGDAMYVNINGRYMKMAMPVGQMIAQYRDPAVLTRIERSMTAEDLGADTVNGEAARKYRYSVTDPTPSTTVVWISKQSGLVIQLQSSGNFHGKSIDSQVSYSGFNDPAIKISAPN